MTELPLHLQGPGLARYEAYIGWRRHQRVYIEGVLEDGAPFCSLPTDHLVGTLLLYGYGHPRPAHPRPGHFRNALPSQRVARGQLRFVLEHGWYDAKLS